MAGLEGEVYGQMVMGRGLYRKGQYQAAQIHFENLLWLIERHQKQKVTMELLNDAEYTAHIWLGGIQADLGNFTAAKAQFNETIRLAQALNKPRSTVQAKINLANLLRRMYDYAAARQLYEECLQITRNLGDQWGEGETQVELGDVIRILGEYTLANDLYLRAEALLGKSGYAIEQTCSQIMLARLHCYLGNYAQARQWLARASNAALLQESTWLQVIVCSLPAKMAAPPPFWPVVTTCSNNTPATFMIKRCAAPFWKMSRCIRPCSRHT